MKIRELTLDDVEILIRLRLDFIMMVGVELSDEKEREIRIQLDKYYRKHIPLGDFVAFLAEDDRKVMSAAFMVIGERPAGAWKTRRNRPLINGGNRPVKNGLQ